VSDRILEFDVIGLPSPQGSKRAFVRNGRANLVEVAGAALKDWRTSVTARAVEAARDVDWVILEGPVAVEVLFRLPRPKSRPHDVWHAVRPDVDKLARAVLDAVSSARLWVDDCQVSDLRAWKRYDTPDHPSGALIAVREVR
jgi:Holliday junction resolvase RusA-like endonuclease